MPSPLAHKKRTVCTIICEIVPLTDTILTWLKKINRFFRLLPPRL
ncbi:hypothetical protein UUU_43000 [Klebsiella pneumoniae subsp. pneumoniae DSM 30104 = JCM 1662 = NBRC 14940]|nr:hypothetical protein UUU_43000 [Klebsiella pneumoniae subsp. pneumoniae DSM 30104 = JCM 1662 = NBRC 14940]